jgi:hypothetical protein
VRSALALNAAIAFPKQDNAQFTIYHYAEPVRL